MALHLLDSSSRLCHQEAVLDSYIYLLEDVWICDYPPSSPQSSDSLPHPFSEALTGWAALGFPKSPYWNLYALRELVHMSYSQLSTLVENSWCREGPMETVSEKGPASKTPAGGVVPPREGCQPLLLDSTVFCLGLGPAWVGSWLFLLRLVGVHTQRDCWHPRTLCLEKPTNVYSALSFPSFLGPPLPLQDIIKNLSDQWGKKV